MLNETFHLPAQRDAIDQAKFLIKEGRRPEAITVLETYLEANPTKGVAHTLLGGTYQMLAKSTNDPAQAEEYRAKALDHLMIGADLTPDKSRPSYQVAKQLNRRGDHAQAQTYLERVLQLKPSDDDAWLEMSMALQAQGRKDDALMCMYMAYYINLGNKVVTQVMDALKLKVPARTIVEQSPFLRKLTMQ